MSDLERLQKEEKEYMMQAFKRLPVELVRGKGAMAYDDTGKEYLDFVAGIAVNVLGHAHPKVVQAIKDQADTMIHTSNWVYTRQQVELAHKLNQRGFRGRVFFANSGAEANECAVKVARKWGKLNRGGAYGIISAEGSFHGRTLSMVAATGQPKYKVPFEPMPDGFSQVPFNDLEALRAAITDQTVAVLLEPIQGEVGIVPCTQEYMEGVRKLCDEQNLLMILDEVQTGVGRTGTFYAFQGYGIEPDVVTLAKALGGGVPIGACIASPRADVIEPAEHGTTFGGGPLACAAAIATLDAIEEEGVVENARVIGDYFLERLQALAADFDCIADVRGRGLMLALVLDRDIAQALQLVTLEHGLISNAIGERVLRFIPPLIIGKAEVDRAIEIVAASLDLVLAEAPRP
jgi:acetylornithine/N-succinyldiaminopimelate aminotransferase